MQIPRYWVKAEGNSQTGDGRELRVAVWGWGGDNPSAEREANNRLQRLLERIRRGEPFPEKYAYGTRPLREEIVQTLDKGNVEHPAAVVTRNRYGALVLNTARLLFLDIDLPPMTLGQRLRRLFSAGRADPADAALTKLREALERSRRSATFRLYRTAAGFRAIAIDRDFDPAGRDTEELMRLTDTDPAFARLCRVHQSFRARLTPKPWRCGCPLPPGQHPREEGDARQRFAAWCGAYEQASARFATCRYVDTVGSGRPKERAAELVTLHDRVTHSSESLPLA
ncbi:MAG: hypothetical protein HYU76_13435 [Betaproteobacteria bacterium]|nr:hypothetical protein [Betaproteobacteria bacterium]